MLYTGRYLMNENKEKRNKIPSISLERLDTSSTNPIIGNTREDQKAQAFLKGKEITQPFTIRIPIGLYTDLRKRAFDKNEKINPIIINLIRDYINKVD